MDHVAKSALAVVGLVALVVVLVLALIGVNPLAKLFTGPDWATDEARRAVCQAPYPPITDPLFGRNICDR